MYPAFERDAILLVIDLIHAINEHNDEKVEAIILAGADVNRRTHLLEPPFEPYGNLWTLGEFFPLYYAVHAHNEHAVAFLLSRGAVLSSDQMIWQKTVTIDAADGPRIFQLLFNHYLNTFDSVGMETQSSKAMIAWAHLDAAAPDARRDPLLFQAIKDGTLEMLETMLRTGANIDIRKYTNKMHLLQYCLQGLSCQVKNGVNNPRIPWIKSTVGICDLL